MSDQEQDGGWEQLSRPTDIKTEKGRIVEGIYRGFKTIDTQFGDNTVFSFTGKGGIPFQIYGFTSLNRQMDGVSPGALVRIRYDGKEIVNLKQRGPTPMHLCTVWIKKGGGEPSTEPPTPTTEPVPPAGDRFDPDEIPF